VVLFSAAVLEISCDGKDGGMGGQRKCLAPGCPSRYGQGMYFRGLPKNPDLRSKWLNAIPSGTRIIPSALVCEVGINLMSNILL